MIRADPRITLACTAGLCLLAAFALFEVSPLGVRIQLDPSSEPLLPTGDPASAAYRDAVLDFGDDEIYVIAMETEDVFQTRHLEGLRRLARAIAQLPEIRSVESVINVSTVRNDPVSGVLEIGPLIDEIPQSPEALARLRRLALGDPLLVGSLISADGRTAALNVRFASRSDAEHIAAGTDASIRRLIAAESDPERSFHIAGRPHMKATAHSLMRADVSRLMPLAIFVMAGVLGIMTGRLREIAIPIGTVLVATLWTFGVIAACDVSLNLVTIVLGPVLIAVGSVYGVHVLAHYKSAAATAADSADAARMISESTRRPVWIAGVSTVVGFSALLLTDVPAARELGGFAAIGVACVTLLSRTALPAWIALLPLGPRAEKRRIARADARLDDLLARLARFACRRRRAVIGVWAALSCLALVALPRIEIDTDYISFFPRESQLRRDFDAIDQRLSGAIPLYVVLSGNAPGAFARPDELKAVDRLERALAQLKPVTHSTSIAALVRDVNQAIHEDDPAYDRIPDTESGVAELVFVIPKSTRRPFVSIDQSRANVQLRTGARGSSAIRDLVSEIEATIADVVPQNVSGRVTGDTVLLNRSADGLARTQLITVGATACAIFLLVALVFRSVALALVAMLPNLLPVLLFYGLLGSGVASLSLPTSLIASIVLGIAVDDTVHFLTRYRRSRDRGASPEEAVSECGRRVGRPIVITSVMLFLGFMVVALSGFATLQEFGWLVGLTLAICLATDLLLLPAVLVSARIR